MPQRVGTTLCPTPGRSRVDVLRLHPPARPPARRPRDRRGPVVPGARRGSRHAAAGPRRWPVKQAV